MAALTNNSLEVFTLPPPASSKAPAVDPVRLYSLDLPGHRSDIRTLSISSDDALLASASSGSLKIWNIKTTKCVRTMDCGYAICSSFLPGDRHVSSRMFVLCLENSSSSDVNTNRLWSGQNRANYYSTISHLRPCSKRLPHIPVRSGLCMFDRMVED